MNVNLYTKGEKSQNLKRDCSTVLCSGKVHRQCYMQKYCCQETRERGIGEYGIKESVEVKES